MERQNSRLPLDHGGGGVSFGLTGEQHIGSTHVPVVVIAHDSHLRGIWREKKQEDGGSERYKECTSPISSVTKNISKRLHGHGQI